MTTLASSLSLSCQLQRPLVRLGLESDMNTKGGPEKTLVVPISAADLLQDEEARSVYSGGARRSGVPMATKGAHPARGRPAAARARWVRARARNGSSAPPAA